MKLIENNWNRRSKELRAIEFSLDLKCYSRSFEQMQLKEKSGRSTSHLTESPMRDLEVLIQSGAPIVVIESNEEPQVVRMVRQIAQKLHLSAFRWTATDGMEAFAPQDQPSQVVQKSLEVLNYIKSSARSCLFVLLDFHPFMEDTLHVRKLKDIALSYEKHYSTIVLVSYVVRVPEELRPFTSHFKMPLPSSGELREIVQEVAAEWGAANGNRDVQTTNKTLDLLVRNLAGLTVTDAKRLALKAINDNGVISDTDMPEVMHAKYELLGRDSVLSFENETAQFGEIGGMRKLRNWLELRKSFFLSETPQNLDPPRGVLLLGVQGCGKSLAAKAAAGIFGVPLLRLDFGVLYNKYYGETERNLRKALDTAEVMSPCVLWMDEIEKGISEADDDDGLSRRILGTLLTWMSEKRQPVSWWRRPMTLCGCRRKSSARGGSMKFSSWIYHRRKTGGTSWKFIFANAACTRRVLIWKN